MHLTAVRRSSWGQAGDAAAEGLLDAKASWVQLDSLTPVADVIIVVCSQDATTRGFVGQAFLSACKPGVIIVNVARGKPRHLPAASGCLMRREGQFVSVHIGFHYTHDQNALLHTMSARLAVSAPPAPCFLHNHARVYQ